MQNQQRNNDNNLPKTNNSANIVGAFIVLFGIALLFKNLSWGNVFPRWFFGWEMFLIIIGLVIGINSKFEKKSSVILISIGALFILKDLVGISFGKVIIPAIAIILGVYLIKRNRQVPPVPPENGSTPPDDEYDWDRRVVPEEDPYGSARVGGEPYSESTYNAQGENPPAGKYRKYTTQYDNYLKVDSFFSDNKQVMLTSNFLGGTITSVFGSTHINFLQADIQRPVVLDTFQLFGSTKIIIPPHWQVSSNVASIFGELDDRRPLMEITTDNNKKIYVTGTSIFGGLTIKNS